MHSPKGLTKIPVTLSLIAQQLVEFARPLVEDLPFASGMIQPLSRKAHPMLLPVALTRILAM
jgi:hypothetical protein